MTRPRRRAFDPAPLPVAPFPVTPLLVALLLATLPCGVGSGAPLPSPMTQTEALLNDAERVSIEATGWLGTRSTGAGLGPGMVPVVFRVVNGSQREIVVSIDGSAWGEAAVIPRTRFVVPAGATASETVFVETLADGTGGASMSLYLLCNRSGSLCSVDVRPILTYSSLPTTIPIDIPPRVWSPAALSRLLPADAAWTVGPGNPEGVIDPAAAPDDWRGWTMLRELVITDDEWDRLPASRRQALLGWLAFGGILHVVADDRDPARLDRIGLPPADADGARRVGAGEVVALAPDAESWERLHDPTPRPREGSHPWPTTAPHTPWSPGILAGMAGFQARGLPFVPILLFLAIFAGAAGPVNVMLAARRGSPARIFWTTPLLSLVATTFLVGLMFLRDGVGGAGVRRTLCILDPDHATAAVLQNQFSRTGILFGRAFTTSDRARMRPENVTNHSLRGQRGASFVEQDDRRRTGDWFRSRADQAFRLSAVRPSRGRIELVGPADAPRIVSSIDVPLARVIVRGEDGRLWTCGAIGAGQEIPLEPAETERLDTMLARIVAGASGEIDQAVQRLRSAPGHAWAEAADPGRVAIATHGEIRWNDDQAWFVVPAGRRADR